MKHIFAADNSMDKEEFSLVITVFAAILIFSFILAYGRTFIFDSE